MTIRKYNPIDVPSEYHKLGVNLIEMASARNGGAIFGIQTVGSHIVSQLKERDRLIEYGRREFFDNTERRVGLDVLIADQVPWHDDLQLTDTYTDYSVVVPLHPTECILQVKRPQGLVDEAKLEPYVPLKFNRLHKHRVVLPQYRTQYKAELHDYLILLCFDEYRGIPA